MRAVVRFIDAISEWTGRSAHWLCVILVIVMVTSVFIRYVSGASNLWAYESSMEIVI